MLKIKATKALKGREQGMRQSHSGRWDRGPEMEGVGENARGKIATGPRKPAHTVQCSESFRTQ